MVNPTGRVGNPIATPQQLRPQQGQEELSRVRSDSLNQSDRSPQNRSAAESGSVDGALETARLSPVQRLDGATWDGTSPLPRGSIVDIII